MKDTNSHLNSDSGTRTMKCISHLVRFRVFLWLLMFCNDRCTANLLVVTCLLLLYEVEDKCFEPSRNHLIKHHQMCELHHLGLQGK